MTKQVNLLQSAAPWVRPDGGKRFLISADEWVDGQIWFTSPDAECWNEHAPRCPVWVADLLHIPVVIPKVTWIDGHAVAMLMTLPKGTMVRETFEGLLCKVGSDQVNGWPNGPVLVVEWPDGTTPLNPSNGRTCRDCDGDGVWTDIGGDTVDCRACRGTGKLPAFVGQVER